MKIAFLSAFRTRELVTQDVKRRVSNCFVAVEQGGEVVGYNTFAATGLALSERRRHEGVARQLLRQRRGNLRRRLTYSDVVEIGAGRAETMDLCVPGTHSFFANGLVSHNTMGRAATAGDESGEWS